MPGSADEGGRARRGKHRHGDLGSDADSHDGAHVGRRAQDLGRVGRGVPQEGFRHARGGGNRCRGAPDASRFPSGARLCLEDRREIPGETRSPRAPPLGGFEGLAHGGGDGGGAGEGDGGQRGGEGGQGALPELDGPYDSL